jgi:2-oxoisovalerate dehydrogenase E1 component
MKAAYYDPNPVVMLEHKGLYWSKIKGTEDAKTVEPSEDYILPLGKARMVIEAESSDNHATLSIITYGMGVYWAKNAAREFPGRVEVVDLRTLVPLDEDAVFSSVKKHNRCLVLTEEPAINSFAAALAGRIQEYCFNSLDAPVRVLGSENLPAIPLNSTLEAAMLPNATKVSTAIRSLLAF